MAGRIRELFPKCPCKEAEEIARFTAARGSGRIGRSEAGRALDDRVIVLAIRASIRHNLTAYDKLLASGTDREKARSLVLENVDKTERQWRK